MRLSIVFVGWLKPVVFRKMKMYFCDIILILVALLNLGETKTEKQNDLRNITKRSPYNLKTIDLVLDGQRLRVVKLTKQKIDKDKYDVNSFECKTRDCITRTGNTPENIKEETESYSNEALEDWKSYSKIRCKDNECKNDLEEHNIQNILRFGVNEMEVESNSADTNNVDGIETSMQIHVYDLVHRFATLKAKIAHKLFTYIKDLEAKSIAHLQLNKELYYKFINLKQWYHRHRQTVNDKQLRNKIHENLKNFLKIQVLPHDLDDNVILVSPKLYADLEKQRVLEKQVRKDVVRSLFPMIKKQKLKLQLMPTDRIKFHYL